MVRRRLSSRILVYLLLVSDRPFRFLLRDVLIARKLGPFVLIMGIIFVVNHRY